MTTLSDNARKMLGEGKNFATIATLNPDGSPHVTMVWIDTDGEHVIFNTAEGRVKTNNMRRDAHVAVSVTSADNPYDGVTIRGRVVEMTHDGANEHIDKLAKKYMGVDEYPGRAQSPDEQRVIIKISPD